MTCRPSQSGFADLQSDDVLPVYFADVVLGQQAVAGGRAVFDQRGDFARLVDEANMAGAVLVHGDGALEWPVHTQTISMKKYGPQRQMKEQVISFIMTCFFISFLM